MRDEASEHERSGNSVGSDSGGTHAAGDDKLTVLFVDDEEHLLASFMMNFRKKFRVHLAEDVKKAKQTLGELGEADVVVSDLRMPGESGLALLYWLKENHPNTGRILFSGHADIDAALEAVNDVEVFRLLTKPSSMKDLENAIVQAGNASRAQRDTH